MWTVQPAIKHNRNPGINPCAFPDRKLPVIPLCARHVACDRHDLICPAQAGTKCDVTVLNAAVRVLG